MVFSVYIPSSRSVGKESACSAEDLGSVPGLGTSPEEGNGNLLQYSCLGNFIYRGAWWATVQGVMSQTQLLVTKSPPPPYMSVF